MRESASNIIMSAAWYLCLGAMAVWCVFAFVVWLS